MCWFLSATLTAFTALAPIEGGLLNRAPVRLERDGHVLLTAVDRRVRGLASDVQTLLARGMARSSTFSRLMTDIDNTDVIVYVEFSEKLPSATAGRLLFGGSTRAGTRYLRIQLSPEATIAQQIAVLAHELQHALEVGLAPDVLDQASFAQLYERIGSANPPPHGYDTEAARAVGRRVMLEVQDS
jgi:hypothetical protein